MEILGQAWQSVAVGFAAGFIAARWIYRRHANPAPQPDAAVTDAAIDAALRAGRRIEAIRLCRRKYACGLHTAMSDVEARAARLGLHA